ncbi:hypothetical protein FOMG_19980 [Fusarium oxysporum f. sp. melonis 26406]|uniref:Uncharacterized protein n=1 Tax=Fusarium oxysporum f. sp. melonis 26406 TaxID=1089452 RepID=W9Z3N6_FUSOX|nr:hypothetical protein FOMG_19980 [Fusarium oxysporum f. sp. melonis 26406]
MAPSNATFPSIPPPYALTCSMMMSIRTRIAKTP